MERQLYYLVALIGIRVSPKKLAMFQFKVGSFTRTQDENESAAGPKAHLLVCSPVCRQHEMSTEGSLGRGRMALGGGREQGLCVLGTQCDSAWTGPASCTQQMLTHCFFPEKHGEVPGVGGEQSQRSSLPSWRRSHMGR